MMKLLLVAILVVAVAGMTLGHKMCLPPIGKVPFDEVKFSGQWYVVGRLARNGLSHGNLSCSKVDYSVKQDGNITRINMELNVKVDGVGVHLMATGQPLHHHMKSVTQAVWKIGDDKEWKEVVTQSILATDYTSFAIFYVCKPLYDPAHDTFDKMQVVHVWSRTPQMEETLYRVLKVVLASYDFDVEEMIDEDQTAC